MMSTSSVYGQSNVVDPLIGDSRAKPVPTPPPTSTKEHLLQQLAIRLAQGEITQEIYEETKKTIEGL